MSFIFRIIVLAGIFTSVANQLTKERNVIIITDMEPDDRIALAVASISMPNRILFLGTTLMNSQRKAALAEHQLIYFKRFRGLRNALKNVKVFAGTGGTPDNYPKMGSTNAGLSYTHEGEGILDESKLKEFERSTVSASSPNKLQEEILRTLTDALKNGTKVEFILLAAPTDLMAVLAKNMSEYAKVISHIYVMGGWVANNGVLRSTYNVNMDVKAGSQLMEFAHQHKVDTTLWSSHIIKKTFGGGSINADNDNYSDLIKMIFDSTACVFHTIKTAGKSWDEHLMEKIPPLRIAIGEKHAGRQFTPADPLVIVGFLNPEMIKAQRNVSVKIDQEEDKAGYLVEVNEDRSSAIKVVEEIDANIFKTEMENSIRAINAASESHFPKCTIL